MEPISLPHTTATLNTEVKVVGRQVKIIDPVRGRFEVDYTVKFYDLAGEPSKVKKDEQINVVATRADRVNMAGEIVPATIPGYVLHPEGTQVTDQPQDRPANAPADITQYRLMPENTVQDTLPNDRPANTPAEGTEEYYIEFTTPGTQYYTEQQIYNPAHATAVPEFDFLYGLPVNDAAGLGDNLFGIIDAYIPILDARGIFVNKLIKA